MISKYGKKNLHKIKLSIKFQCNKSNNITKWRKYNKKLNLEKDQKGGILTFSA